MKPHYLCYTNFLLVGPIIYFLINKNEVKPWVEYVLVSFLCTTILLSQLFWYNPIRFSVIHKVDAVNAKLVIGCFIVYTLLYKYRLSFLFILAGIAVSFYLSNMYSNQQWCSIQHLYCHAILHLFCFVASFYAFFPMMV